MQLIGPAVWRTRDSDLPIVVTGVLGFGPDGRLYLSIEGSGTGVPIDEVHWPVTPRVPGLRAQFSRLFQFVKGGFP